MHLKNLGIFLLLLVSACRPDRDMANWNIEALTPILKSRLDLEDLRTLDSNLRSNERGIVEFQIRQALLNAKAGEITEAFNASFGNTIKLDDINFGTRRIEERITLGRIADQAGLAGAIIKANHGNTQSTPAITNLGPNSFPIDATDFFQSITVRSGWLILRLENGLPVALENMQYSIGNQGGGSFLQNTLSQLAPGAVHFDSVQLTNGTVIQGQLQATLINVDVAASNGPVLIDTTDALHIDFTVDKLDPYEATAIFPDQELVADTGVSVLETGNAILYAVHVKSGKLFIDATSTVEDIIQLDYRLPGAVKNGQRFQLLETLQAAPPNGSSRTYRETPVVDYLLDLKGLPGSVNTYNTFYTYFEAGVDSSGRLINLSLDDSVFLRTGIVDLRADRAYGFMGYDTLSFEQGYAFENFNEQFEAQFQLKNAEVRLEVYNYMGFPISFRMDPTEQFGNQTNLNWSRFGQELNVPRALERVVGQRPEPGRASFRLLNQNSNVSAFLSDLPDSIASSGEVYLNPNMPISSLNQFLYTDYGVEAFLEIDLPLEVSLQNLLLQDSLDFNYSTFDPKAQIEGGALKVLADNHYPFEMQLQLVLLDENGAKLDTWAGDTPILSGVLDTSGHVLQPLETTVEFPLNRPLLDQLKQAKQLVFQLRMRSPEQAEVSRMRSDDYIDLQLVGDFIWRTR